MRDIQLRMPGGLFEIFRMVHSIFASPTEKHAPQDTCGYPGSVLKGYFPLSEVTRKIPVACSPGAKGDPSPGREQTLSGRMEALRGKRYTFCEAGNFYMWLAHFPGHSSVPGTQLTFLWFS